MRDLLIGLDNGGSLVKAVIFDASGNEIASASEALTIINLPGGITERDIGALWAANCRVIKRAVESAGKGAAQRLAGLACTGHGKGLYLLGKDGGPVGRGIVSTDTRAAAYVRRWEQDGTIDKAFAYTFQKQLACQPAAIMSWILDNEPARLEQARWIFAVKDLIRYMITDEVFFEITDASGSGLINNKKGQYDIGLLEVLGLESVFSKLPPLKSSTDICGYVSEKAGKETGLPPGLPVAGGMFDIDACALAMDIFTPDNLCVIAGTWSINEYISQAPVLDGSVMMNSLYALPGYYLIEESSPTSTCNYEWYINNFLHREETLAKERGVSVYNLLDEIASQIPAGECDVFFMPFIYGGTHDPQARAAFIGFRGNHTRAHSIRALLEGIVYGHRLHIERLLKHVKPNSVRLAGGAAKSAFWTQMFADILGMTIETVETKELGTLGCCMAAGVAAGIFADLKDASKKMVRIGGKILPDLKQHEIYNNKYARFCMLSDALTPCWNGFDQTSGEAQ